ncbi:MAG: gluconeogenesis factor YvcK family protein [Desulfopila sp.]|jgi:uncharacterized cofD-like protein|nr:gluconeogenesis factor YvcK family protein [Desulfopila sp.]
MNRDSESDIKNHLSSLSRCFLSPLDLLPHADIREKCIDLVLNGIPGNADHSIITHFHKLRQFLLESRVNQSRVVVFGGGTGLSNIIGGDSRLSSWAKDPFSGLKEVFPRTRSVVCVTDDGGSTGELIKDLPIVALGDIRHVLLSSVQLHLLQKRYSITAGEAEKVASGLAEVFNFRFSENEICQDRAAGLLLAEKEHFPLQLNEYLSSLLEALFTDIRLKRTLLRPHCFGNLLLAAAIYKNIPQELTNSRMERKREIVSRAFSSGINEVSGALGAIERAVLPCTTTPAQLRLCYTNGVEATGESKSGEAERGYPVDRVVVDFSDKVHVPETIFADIAAADILILAPGSLYSSIIPIFQVPGIAEAVRNNHRAHKLLISNLWVQAGETDIAISDPDRKFHVSDMIRAYERNIPGGTRGLFYEVLCLSLKDVPASIIQNYALEGKIPIYLDRKIVCRQGYLPVECGIFSKNALAERGVIQHDPAILAQAVKTVYTASRLFGGTKGAGNAAAVSQEEKNPQCGTGNTRKTPYPSRKYRQLNECIEQLPVSCARFAQDKGRLNNLKTQIVEIIWKHRDISTVHLEQIKGLVCIEKDKWKREQVWDKVYSFFDPADSYVKIRADQLADPRKLETAILIAIGQSLLGNYAARKKMDDVVVGGNKVGKIYHLYLRERNEIQSFFSADELDMYLHFSRMHPADRNRNHYTRLISGNEGFTPPGVLMGLTFAWYLDNRLASHIEYKMALMKIHKSDLIPEQLKMLHRRNSIVGFFRDCIFSR